MLRYYRRLPRRVSIFLGTTAIAVVANGSASLAATVIWGGTQPFDWQDANNWFVIGGGNAVPTSSDAVLVDWTSPAVLSSFTGYAGGIVVGGVNSGTLTVSSGAHLMTGTGFIGNGPGSTGTVTVTGAGSSWIVQAGMGLDVGYYGTGTLNVLAGATVGATPVTFGHFAGSSGTVNVDGAGSVFTAAGSLTIGEYGRGTLNVSNGGQVHASNTASVNVTLGHYTGASGAVTVDGSGSQLIANGLITIGGAGTGTVALTNGASMRTPDALLMAETAAAQGTLKASGSGTALQIGSSANTYMMVG